MRGLLDPELCRQARQRMWEVNEVPRCSPTDPDSWRAAFSADESSSDTGNFRSGFNWRSRSIGTEELFLKLLPHNPKVLAIADELMGPGTVAPCDSTGGVYAIMPRPPNVARSPNLGLHVDSHLESRERIGLVGYIADVKPNSGAFGVWPRTHLRCWNLLRQVPDDRFASVAPPLRFSYRWRCAAENRPAPSGQHGRRFRRAAQDCWRPFHRADAARVRSHQARHLLRRLLRLRRRRGLLPRA